MSSSGDPGDLDSPRLAPVQPGDVVADKYVIERELGVGGMGIVLAARDRFLQRRVAIKFLLPKFAWSETAVQRFFREAQAATRITSEHVVRLLNVDKLPSGVPFFVMEYLEGEDLRTILQERGPLPLAQAVDWLLQALQAVAEGHKRGVVHRDLKPSNLFVTYRADGTVLVKVLDFGIAKTVDDGVDAAVITGSEDVRLGSPAYMPPEQLRSARDVDERSDIWALGVTLYEMLTATLPFEGEQYVELLSRIIGAPPAPIRDRRPDLTLPDGLESIIRKCLQKDRAERYAHAVDLAAALAPYGSDDARVSLSRIRGLSSARPTPERGPARANDPNSCTTTLPVAAEASSPSAASSRPAVPPGSTWRRRHRARIGILVAALLAAGGVALFLAWRPATIAVHSSLPGAASPKPVPSSSDPEEPSVERREPEAEAPPEKGVRAQPAREAAAGEALAASLARAPLPQRGVKRGSTPAATSADPRPAPAPSSVQDSRSDAPPANTSGRSSEIERLILDRH